MLYRIYVAMSFFFVTPAGFKNIRFVTGALLLSVSVSVPRKFRIIIRILEALHISTAHTILSMLQAFDAITLQRYTLHQCKMFHWNQHQLGYLVLYTTHFWQNRAYSPFLRRRSQFIKLSWRFSQDSCSCCDKKCVLYCILYLCQRVLLVFEPV